MLIVEVVSELMQGWKKCCSGGKIKLKEKKAEFKVYKIWHKVDEFDKSLDHRFYDFDVIIAFPLGVNLVKRVAICN